MKRISGYTLLEVMLALFIFSIMSLVVVNGLNTVLRQYERARFDSQNLSKLQSTMLLMTRDFRQVVDRPIVNSLGKQEPAFLVNKNDGREYLEFTRMGNRTIAAKHPHSTLQRVMYTVKDGKLIRYIWHAIDRLNDKPDESKELLVDISKASWRYFDDKGRDYDLWPPVSKWRDRLPHAVEVRMEFVNEQTLRRVFSVKR